MAGYKKKLRAHWAVICLSALLNISTTYADGSVNTNAVYDGNVWSYAPPSGDDNGVTPGPDQDNKFKATGNSDALTVTNNSGMGNAVDLGTNEATTPFKNTINGNFTVDGGSARLSGSINEITKKLSVTNGGEASLSQATNTIDEILVTNGGSSYLSESTNNITGGISVTDGGSAYLLNSTKNDITGGLSVTGTNSIANLFRTTNNITGGISVTDGGSADLYGSTNHIIGSVLVTGDGSTAFLIDSTNTIDEISVTGTGSKAHLTGSTNIITSGISAVDGGLANLRGSTNTITGGVLVTGTNSNADLTASTNTIDTVTVNKGTLSLGAQYNNTTITTMDWSEGTFIFYWDGESFGKTSINDLNITGSLQLSVNADAGGGGQLDYLPTNRTYTLFTVNKFNGNQNLISLTNLNSLFELKFDPSSTPGGVNVDLVPVDTTPDNMTDISDYFDNNLISIIQNTEIQGTQAFAPTASSIARARVRLQKAFRENRQDSFEAAMTAFSESDTPILKLKGDYRIWVSPYAVRVRNRINGFTEKSYGLMLGASRYLKSIETNLTGVIGFGMSKAQKDDKANSNIKGQSLILGLVATKQFWDKKVELISSLYGMGTLHKQQRQANPQPGISYVADSRYKTASVSFRNELGYVMKLQDGFSVRPNIGVQGLANYRTSISENNIPSNYAQRYSSQTKYSGEVYTGLGFRKKWESDQYEGKVTLSYAIGRLSGNGRSAVTVYTDSTPQGVEFASEKPGLTTQYINLYGSVLDKKNNWKIVPGCSYSFQKGRNTVSGTLKLEYRW